MPKLFILLLLAPTLLVGCLLYFASQPQDLSKIGGVSPLPPGRPRNIKAILENSIKRDTPVTLTEADFNDWIASHLEMKQSGPLAHDVSLERVLLKFEDQYAEVIMERKVKGKPFTVSMYVQVDSYHSAEGIFSELMLHGGSYFNDLPKLKRGGKLGKLEIPQGFLLLLLPAYEKLAQVFTDEAQLMKRFIRITFEKGKITFDPRESLSEQILPKSYELRQMPK